MVRRSGGLFPAQPLRREVDHLFSDLFSAPGTGWAFGRGRTFPPINVWEDGDNLYVEAELPGVKSENLDIAVVGNELTIKGERPVPSEDGVTYHRRERGTGSFTRVVVLPVEVDANQVNAAMNNGVLLITLPKSEAAKPRKVKVKAGK
jgi:HSP20 family protein